jgi:GT2 family glycosyltransferase
MSQFAPIVLFVYARPEHTRQTLEALAANPEAKDSLLYVFADGPPDGAAPGLRSRIDEVRRIVRERPWCGEVRIIESDVNRGLADSIIGGVTEVVGRHGRVIVLEDDIACQPGALAYFNSALEIYQNSPKVMQISGFMVRTPLWTRRTGFLRVSTSWGWATWDRAWEHFRNDASALLKEVNEAGRSAFDLDGSSFHYDELVSNVTGELRTWAIKWYASIFLVSGLCLYPARSLVRNVGFDGSGENCEDDSSGYFKRIPLARAVKVAAQEIVESDVYLKAMQKSYQYRLKVWTKTRIRDRIIKKLRRICFCNA